MQVALRAMSPRTGPRVGLGPAFGASGAIVVLALLPAQVHAQVLWSALDTKPKPNLIIAYDVSVTMQIASNCNPEGCHAIWRGDGPPILPGSPWNPQPGWPGIRLQGATEELIHTLPLFKSEFIYGGFRYDTCGPNGQWLGHSAVNPGPEVGQAEISYMTSPDRADPLGSFQRTWDMVNDIAHEDDSGPTLATGFQTCEHAEGATPSGNLATARCATPNCANEVGWSQSLIQAAAAGQIQGLKAPNLPTGPGTINCDLLNPVLPPGYVWITPPPVQAIDPFATLAANIQGQMGLYTPHSCSPTFWQSALLCKAIETSILQLQASLIGCTSTPPPVAQGVSCDPLILGSNLCTCGGGAGTAVLDNSCICNSSQAGCVGGGIDPCNIPWYFRSNAQNAICAAYDPFSSFPPANKPGIGRAFLEQADNVVNGGCRENAVMFFTDGTYSDSPGVAPEGLQATSPTGPFFGPYQASPYFSPLDQVSNAFVFLAASPPVGWPQFSPTALAAALGQPNTYAATDQTTLYVSFAEVANRLKRGVFTPASPALDTHGTRLASMTMWVPGMPKLGQPSYPDQSYFGRPSRLSWWPMDPNTGARGAAPICETDWASRAGYPNRLLTASGVTTVPPPDVERALGPPLANETWESGGLMLAQAPDDGSLDRGGASGTPVAPKASGGFVFGYMLNAGPTQPVVVEAPVDQPPLADANFVLFEQFNRKRERMVYTMAGGYLFGIRAGVYQDLTPPADPFHIGVQLEYDYHDSDPADGACTESFRYLPSWVVSQLQDPIDPLAASGDHVNRLIAQTYTNGQISVRETKVASNGDIGDYATVLVMSQGAGGPWLSALDVTAPSDPTKLKVLGEWSLPGASDVTSAEPTLYNFPAIEGGKGSFQAVVVMPGGDGGSSNLYSFVIRRGGVSSLSTAPLPGGNYPSSAVCFDGRNRGSITDCVVLSDSGGLVRVAVNPDGTFGSVTDLSPSYAATLGAAIAGERFYTHPAVFFTAENDVAYVFGSGDVKNITAPAAVRNRAYKVVDGYGRGLGASAGTVCSSSPSVGTTGIIELSHPAEVIVSPPIVSRGVVAFTTYIPGVNGCSTGKASVYSMNFETCADSTDPTQPRPVQQPAGAGIPLSPVYLRSSDHLILQTSSGYQGASQTLARGVGKTNQNRSAVIPLYWRMQASGDS